MYSFLKAFLVLMKLLSLPQFYAPKSLSPTFGQIRQVIPRQAIELESCSTPLKMRLAQ